VVVSIFKRKFAAAALCVAGFVMMGSSPALANSATAASAELPAPIRTAETPAISGGDENFKSLFAQWESLDGGSTTPTAPVATVSIPSLMPLRTASLTSGYGMRTHPVLRKRRAHKGVDLAAPTGTPIYATADGIVSKAERFSSYGLYVSMEHGAQVQTRFAHMSRIAVANGQNVKKGDIIGYVGSTGRSTGPHLHYEVRVAGRAVNPIPYMTETDAQQVAALNTTEGGRGGN
jgi:murein DD-endopeptidase MepM/ murein hydrolase activator NlpD